MDFGQKRTVTRSRRLLVVATVAYGSVVVALTTLKAFFRIGYLWEPARQRARDIRIVPFDEFFRSSWFGPLFEYGGNFAFFIPMGVLLYLWREDLKSSVLRGAGFSAAIETAQFIFGLGRTDIDDLLFNTLGALVGALIAKGCGRRFYAFWQWLAILVGAVFVVLVALGPRLGDPSKVKELAAPTAIVKVAPAARNLAPDGD